MSEGVYIISVAAELAGVHPQTLRTYERKGLLKPSRTAGGTRRYSERDVRRVQLIQELTQRDGVNLAGVLRILALQDQLEAAHRRLETMEATMVQLRAQAQETLQEAARRASREIVLYRQPQIERHPGSGRARRTKW